MFMQRFRTKEWINEWITQIWNLGYRILCYLFWSAEYTHFCYCYTISNTDCREIWKLYFLVSSDHSFCNSFSHEICSMKNARISYSFLLISQGANLWYSTPTYFFFNYKLCWQRGDHFSKKSYPNSYYEKYIFAKDLTDTKRVLIWKFIDSENKVKETNKQSILSNFF